jgi:hypothetical protein
MKSFERLKRMTLILMQKPATFRFLATSLVKSTLHHFEKK